MAPPQDATGPRAAGPARRGRRDGALFVAVFTALLVLPPVGHHLIVKSDEARYALLARDMVARGVWVSARVEGETYRNKPPLFPWSIAVLARMRGGVDEATAQLPSAVAAIIATLGTFLLGERLFTRRAGLWAALILATSASFFGHSQQILPDMLALGFAIVAAHAFWCAVSAPGGRGSLVGFYAALALAVFAKGPVGLLPLLVAAGWLVSERGLRRGIGYLLSPAGLAVFGAVTLGWLLPYLAVGSQSFGEHVVWQDWLVTYLGPPLPRRVWRYVLDALAGFMPWTVLVVVALPAAIRERRSPAVRYVLLLLIVPLLVIVLSHSRLPRYLLPVYPGTALLVAWWAETLGATRTRLGRVVGWASFVGALAAIAVLPRVLAVVEPDLLLEPGLMGKTLPVLVCVALLGIVFLLGLGDARPMLLVGGGVGVMAMVLGYGAWLANAWTDRTEDFRAMAAVVRRHAPEGDLRVFTRAKLLPLDFYYGRELARLETVAQLREYLAQTERPTVLIDAQNLRITPAEVQEGLRALETLRIHEQRLFILGCGGAERDPGRSPCRASDPRRR